MRESLYDRHDVRTASHLGVISCCFDTYAVLEHETDVGVDGRRFLWAQFTILVHVQLLLEDAKVEKRFGPIFVHADDVRRLEKVDLPEKLNRVSS